MQIKSFKNKYILLVSLLIVVLSACNNVFEKKVSFENNKLWNYKDSLKYEVNIDDINKLYNVYLDIDNTDLYKYSNIYLFVKLKSPDNNTKIDTVDVILADYRGKWFGEKDGNTYKGHYLFKKNIFFPKTGKYTFIINHGMRDDNLKGIRAIGLSIEKSETK
jgi:gliding motility-associated lipoprotein GldH